MENNLIQFDLSLKKPKANGYLSETDLLALETELERLIKVNSECTAKDIDILMRLDTEIMNIIDKLENSLTYGNPGNIIEFKRNK